MEAIQVPVESEAPARRGRLPVPPVPERIAPAPEQARVPAGPASEFPLLPEHDSRADEAPDRGEEQVQYRLFRRRRDPEAELRPPGVTPQDSAWYPLREDGSEVEGPIHALDTSYLHEAVPILDPRWEVHHAVGLYLFEGDDDTSVEADLLVIGHPYENPDKKESVIRAWLVKQFLFAAEVLSPSNTRDEMDEKMRKYAEILAIPECLEIDPYRKRLTLYRLERPEEDPAAAPVEEATAGEAVTLPEGRGTPPARKNRYVVVDPDEQGRLCSTELGAGFEMDSTEFVWLLKPDGGRILRHQDDHARAEAADRRAATAQQQAAAALQQAETERQWAEAALAQLVELQARQAAFLAERQGHGR